jgi:hypothetical protein
MTAAMAESHEDCGMPMSTHQLACPGTIAIMAPATPEEWLNMIEWALDGLRNEMSDK